MQRAERLDAFVPVNRVVDAGGVDVEIIKTLADCIATEVYYRAPRMSGINAIAYWPPEITSHWGAHGGRDMVTAHFDPVLPQRRHLVLGFGSHRHDRLPRASVEVPIDRARTSNVERYLADPVPPAVETDGVKVEVLDARMGVLRGLIEVLITSTDDSILRVEMGWPEHMHHAPGGPGPAELWREWHPEEATMRSTKRRMPDGTWQVSMEQNIGGLVAVARATPADAPPLPEPPPEPPAPVTFRSLPNHEPLFGSASTRGSGGHGLPTPATIAPLTHEPLSDDAAGVEAIISGLYACRAAASRIITVPRPDLKTTVDLAGAGFDTPDGRIQLIRWEPSMSGSYDLIVRPPAPDLWADVRIVHGDESVSLWMRPHYEGTIRGGLPRMYNTAFEHPGGVRVGLRMIAKPAPEVRIPVALTAPGA